MRVLELLEDRIVARPMPVKVLVTGCAGFIGYHVAEALLARGDSVVGLDNLNDYYDVRLKQARLDRLREQAGVRLPPSGCVGQGGGGRLVADHGDLTRDRASGGSGRGAALAGGPVCLCAGQCDGASGGAGGGAASAGAAASGLCQHVVGLWREYGDCRSGRRIGWITPVSLYAATKRADELMSHAYAHLFGLPQTGLRFFTVYGPWGRPDMAYFSFARAIVAGRADHAVRRGPAAAGFHLYRRYRGRDRRQFGPAAGGCRACRGC